MPTFIAKSVTYYAPGDEAAFFRWLGEIACIDSVEGVGKELRIVVGRNQISDKSLRELIAIFHRYKVSMRQLAQFRTTKNAAWFADPRTFWSRKVFGGN
jgi:hypothetical protein